MSLSSERLAWREAASAYSMLTVPEVARFLRCSEPIVRGLLKAGVIPSITVGGREKVDPLDLAVHVLAERDGITAADYWKIHGEATPEHARRYYARIRKVTAA